MTEPINEILPKRTESEITEILLKFSILIDEFVNFGTHVFKWINQESKGGDEQLPMIMFFRDMLEKADSISILIRNSSANPSKVILRSIFELYLYIDYLTEKNFNDRSMAFLVWNVKRKIRLNRAFDNDNQEYNNLQKKIEKDKSFFDKSFFQDLPSVKPALKNLNSLLKRDEYQKALKEFERTKKRDGRNPSWYRLFNGSRNIQELANNLNMSFLYEILYRSWSDSVHSTDIIQGKIVSTKASKSIGNKVFADIIQIRLPKDAQNVTSYTLLLLLKTFIIFSDKKIPNKNKEIKDWYLSVRSQLSQVTGKKQFIKIKY